MASQMVPQNQALVTYNGGQFVNASVYWLSLFLCFTPSYSLGLSFPKTICTKSFVCFQGNPQDNVKRHLTQFKPDFIYYPIVSIVSYLM